MHRNTPIFILVLSAFASLAGLVLWTGTGCAADAAACGSPSAFFGAVLTVVGAVAVLLSIVLEGIVGLRQSLPEDLPTPPKCHVCGTALFFFHDYGLWYCPACFEYSIPKTASQKETGQPRR